MSSPVGSTNCTQLQYSLPPPEIRIEVADNIGSSRFIDRFFNSAVIVLSLLLISGGLWVVSRVLPNTHIFFLEEIALAVFTITLISFAVLGLTAMCVVCGNNDNLEDTHRQSKDNEMMTRSASQEAERSCDTVCENSSTL